MMRKETAMNTRNNWKMMTVKQKGEIPWNIIEHLS